MRRLTDRQKELLTGISVPLAALLVLALGELVMRAVHQLRYGTGQGIEDDSLWRDDPLTGVRVPRPGASMGNIEINALGLSLVQPGGFFFTSSCSFHVLEDRFLAQVHDAAAQVGRRLRVIRRGEQASDHPVDPAVPETRYLKSYAFHVQMA